MDTTVLENVVVVAQIRGDARAQALHAAFQALNIVGLKARRHDQAKHLNGGARARLALAMAVAGLPQGAPVLLDEPSAGLSAKSIQEVGWAINNLQENGEFAFVIVTHDRLLASMLRKPRYFLLKERNLYPFAIRSRARAAKHAPAIARADAEMDPAELPSVETPPQPAVPRGESHESLVGQIFGSDEQVRDVLTIHA
jgi:ABC-type multidrug transport system ATPase subunit